MDICPNIYILHLQSPLITKLSFSYLNINSVLLLWFFLLILNLGMPQCSFLTFSLFPFIFPTVINHTCVFLSQLQKFYSLKLKLLTSTW